MSVTESIKGKNILITGGAGFIGSHLANLLKTDNKVFVIGKTKPDIIPDGVLFEVYDICDDKFLTFLENESFDYIFHFAGNASPQISLEDPEYDFQVNLLSTFKILNILKKNKSKTKFIYASSVAVYGDCKDDLLSEDSSMTLPISNYGVSKLSAEKYVCAFNKQYGVNSISLRIFSTFGPGLKRQIVYDLINKLSNNPKSLEILGDGTESRDMTFVFDQVKNIVKVAQYADYNGEVYNLGSGQAYSTKYIAELIAKTMNLNPKFIFTKNIRVFDGHTWTADIAKIKDFGCDNFTDFNEGIEETINWYNKQK